MASFLPLPDAFLLLLFRPFLVIDCIGNDVFPHVKIEFWDHRSGQFVSFLKTQKLLRRSRTARSQQGLQWLMVEVNIPLSGRDAY